jgi:hypothetical protein
MPGIARPAPLAGGARVANEGCTTPFDTGHATQCWRTRLRAVRDDSVEALQCGENVEAAP